MKIISFLLSSLLLSASTALDVPEGVTHDFDTTGMRDDDIRDLQAFTQCPTRVSICEAVTGGISIPAENMLNFLDGLDGNEENTLVDNLKDIITLAGAADFLPIATAAQSNSVPNVMNVIRGVIMEVRSIDPAQADATGTATAIGNVVKLAGGLVGIPEQSNTLDIFIMIITLIINILLAIPQGPIAIIVVVFQALIAFLASFTINIAAITIFPSSDPACMSELMLCQYTKMMLTAAPALLAGVFSASAEEASP
jgi:hypothetical protein